MYKSALVQASSRHLGNLNIIRKKSALVQTSSRHLGNLIIIRKKSALVQTSSRHLGNLIIIRKKSALVQTSSRHLATMGHTAPAVKQTKHLKEHRRRHSPNSIMIYLANHTSMCSRIKSFLQLQQHITKLKSKRILYSSSKT